jgi:hypothetical protein
MLSVFQEGYHFPKDREALDPSIRTLLEHEGLPLFDKQNVYVEAAISDLAELVK